MSAHKTIVIIQARTASKRLHDKVMRPFSNGYNLLDYCLYNVSKIKGIDAVYVATTTDIEDDKLVNHCKKKAYIHRGGEENVMKRFVDIIDTVNPKQIIRVCADNPFLISEGIDYLISNHAFHDYTSFKINQIPAMLLPAGLFAECVDADALKCLYETAGPVEKEHVTYGFYNHRTNRFSCNFIDVKDFSEQADDHRLRFTIDTENDFNMIDSIIRNLDLDLDITPTVFRDILDHVEKKGLLKAMISESHKLENLKK